MNIEKKLRVKHTQRNINRVNKWLNLSNDFQGWVTRAGQRVGYKLSDGKYITYFFCK